MKKIFALSLSATLLAISSVASATPVKCPEGGTGDKCTIRPPAFVIEKSGFAK